MSEFSNVIREAISSHINGVHTSFPARIIEVSETSIDVQPLVSVQQGSGYRQLPLLFNVPYLSSCFGSSGIFVKPKIGDHFLNISNE